MSPVEKFTMESDGSSKDLRGLFRTPKENIAVGTKGLSRTNGRYTAKDIPKSSHGLMDINKTKFNSTSLKNLEINNINKEVEQLYPSTHEFWKEESLRKTEFLSWLV